MPGIGDPIPGQSGPQVQAPQTEMRPVGGESYTLPSGVGSPKSNVEESSALGSTENSTEAQNEALVTGLDDKNKALEGRVLLYATVGGNSITPSDRVLIFQGYSVDTPDGLGAAGVHSKLGPILLPYSMADQAKGFKEANRGVMRIEPEQEKQLQLVQDQNSFEKWNDRLHKSIESANAAIATEAAKKQFIPKALEAFRSIQ